MSRRLWLSHSICRLLFSLVKANISLLRRRIDKFAKLVVVLTRRANEPSGGNESPCEVHLYTAHGAQLPYRISLIAITCRYHPPELSCLLSESSSALDGYLPKWGTNELFNRFPFLRFSAFTSLPYLWRALLCV